MKKIFLLLVFSTITLRSFAQEINYYKSFATQREMKFGGDFLNCFPSDEPGIYKLKQGYGDIMANKSINNEKIKIGKKIFEHGIGTHTDSEIKVILSAKAKYFTAIIGKDLNDYSKRAYTQKLVFSVILEGKEIWKSKALGLNDEPLKIKVPVNAKEFNLKVVSDGNPDFGHADWAEATVELLDGKKLRLDEMNIPRNRFSGLPFSFVLGGKQSSDFIHSWNMKSVRNKLSDRITNIVTWTKPEGDFEVRAEAVQFLNHPAVEWKVFFKNTGNINSPILKDIRSLNTTVNNGDLKVVKSFLTFPSSVKVHYNRGSEPSQYDFQPLTHHLLTDESFKLNTHYGRASERYLPFWNLDYNNCGYVTAIGWSGSWDAEFNHFTDYSTNIKAGLTHAELYLKPGEEIISPSVCMLYWEGADPLRGNNLFRRYMKDTWVPKLQGKDPIISGMVGNPSADQLELVNEENQIEFIRKSAAAGADAYWMDAGWNEDGKDGVWVSARGNWFHNKKKFPKGMKALADECHKNGMKFILWFDPEVVTPGTEIAEKHPEYVIWYKGNKELTGLYDLGNPEALAYLTDLIDKKIKEYGVDIFRTDYNMDPQYMWSDHDEEKRLGDTEIKYVEGLYKFWDELLKRNPGLLIDNCASGGKRIDYETSKRAVPFWRSDIECYTDSSTMWESQNQTYGLSYFLPNHSTGNKYSSSIYDHRSLTSSSLLFGIERDVTKPLSFPVEEIKQAFSEAKTYNYLFQADYYPLTDYCVGTQCWMALQYDSPERGEGLVMVFRRGSAPFPEAEFELKALDPKAKYLFSNFNTGKEITLMGTEAKKLFIRLNKEESAVVKYKKIKAL